MNQKQRGKIITHGFISDMYKIQQGFLFQQGTKQAIPM
jgi:hypothetical protein